MRLSLVIILCVAAGSVLAGCQNARVSEPLTRTITGDDADAQLEFWHQLEQRPITSNDDAFHGLLLYLDQSDPNADYAARVSALKSRNILPHNFNSPAEESITR